MKKCLFIATLFFSWLFAADDMEVDDNVVIFMQSTPISSDVNVEPINNYIDSLDINDDESIVEIGFLKHFYQLKNLRLDFCCNITDNIAPIFQLSNLRALSIRGIGLTNTKPLAQLTYLDALDIGGNPINTFCHISKLVQLKYLSVNRLFKVSNREPLQKLVNLIYLDMECMFIDYVDKETGKEWGNKYQSLKWISKLVKLKTFIGNGNNLFKPRDFEFVFNLPSIERIECGGWEYLCPVTQTQIRNHPTLKHLKI